ncbi:MAG: isoprenylcysteine carboxylmethyltransferase family protein [Cyanobacteria bacterium SZAS-4]|nr:isoprenylcysteine carboxylmethyltransferase family protein [Cyanobacteria bacterium SZAS-4]
MNEQEPASIVKFNRPKASIISIGVCAISAAIEFAIAGTWKLPFFWAVFIIQAITAIVSIYILEPNLLHERMHPQGEDKDKFGRHIVTALYLVSIFLPALDVGRLHFCDRIPLPLQYFGALLNVLGWAGIVWAMRINMYFSSAIRLQPDRNQQVITTGPYRVIRHPGYSFASLGFIGQTLMFGSWLGMIPTILLVIDFAYRSFLEEKILVDGLPGYGAYMEQVKSRWIPGLF